MIYIRPKNRISIKKKFMEDNFNSSDITDSSVDEDYSWIKKKDKENLKKLFIKYQFKKWKNILNINYSDNNKNFGEEYKANVGKIFKDDIFKNENVIIEEGENNIFKKYIADDFKFSLSFDIHPDFIVKNIKKENFIKILNDNRHMFRIGKKFQIPDEANTVTLIGECKISPRQNKNKKKQKINYLSFRDEINKKQKDVYFIIFYVFDHSYESFWNKTSIENNNIMVSYIPKLYSKKHLEIFDELIKEINNNEKDIINDTYKNNNNDINKDYNDINVNINTINNENNNKNDLNADINNKRIKDSNANKIINNDIDINIKNDNINDKLSVVINTNNEINDKISNNLPNKNLNNSLFFLDIYEDLDKKFESIIDSDEIDNSPNEEKIQEKKLLKCLFKSTIEQYKQEKKNIDIFRKIEDSILKKKREKEDEELVSNYQKKFKELEVLFNELKNQRNKNL